MNNLGTNQLHFLTKLTLTIFLLMMLGTIIFFGREVIVPFSFAILLSVLLLPLNSFLENKKIPRVISIVISLVVSFIFIGGTIYFLAHQIGNFMEDIPTIKKQLDTHYRNLQSWVYKQFSLTRREQTQIIHDAKEQISGSGSGVIGQTFLSLTQSLMFLLLMPVYTFLILYYRDMIRKFLIDIFEKKHEEKVREVLKESKTIVQSYMTGLMIELGIVAAANSIGFLILGIKYAIFLGVLAAILNLIPYIGMLIATAICMLITLTTTTDISDVIWTGVILSAIQFIDNNILMPKIVSSKVKINALITILGVLIGGGLAGIPGMFLSIPAIAILKVIFDRVDHLRPWGMMLGDEITMEHQQKMYKRITGFSSRKKKAAVTAKAG